MRIPDATSCAVYGDGRRIYRRRDRSGKGAFVSVRSITATTHRAPGSPVTRDDFIAIMNVCREISERRDHRFDPRQEDIKKGMNALTLIETATKRSDFE